MSTQKVSQVFLLVLLACGACLPSFAQTDAAAVPASVVPSRITERIDETQLVTLPGNRHPAARAANDQGRVEPSLPMKQLVLVLKRSPEQEAALAAFNARQLDSNSPDYHHWLHAEEFGRLYGPSDADIASITGWLERHGFQIDTIEKGRVNIQFSGTAAQVDETFHVEMHNYLVAGEKHIANDRNPQIPVALSPVVAGVASLHNFFGHHLGWAGDYVHRDPKTGAITKIEPQPGKAATRPLSSSPMTPLPETIARPALTYTNQSSGLVHEDLTPADFAIVYNMNPLFNAGITGKGVTVAITATSDVTLNDIATYRSTFGLPATTVNVIETNQATDPGISDPGENTEDLEMVSAAAPGATLDLVVSNSTNTTPGYILSNEYIVDNELAPIMTVSYGQCELAIGTTGNTNANSVFQQGSTEGITIFVAAGDSGAATCERQETTAPAADVYGDEVSGFASTPYATAVGGTDFIWSYGVAQPYSYWNSSNSSTGATAKGYIPEIPWNTTCANPFLLNVFTDGSGNPEFSNNEQLCNAAIGDSTYGGLVTFSAGGGGYSHCTTNSTPANESSLDPTSCSGGYAKPSWQSAPGVPADGKRDVPDISMFGSYGYGGLHLGADVNSTAILVCISDAAQGISCNYTDPSQIIYQENGGTSAASPFSAGVMALILQKTGQAQGLANPEFYKLAASQNTSACNAMTVAAGNSCYFFDVTQGSNAQVCITGDINCVTNTSGDQVGIMDGFSAGAGYDRATGLGTMNVTNLVNAWPTAAAPTFTFTPTSLAFGSVAVGVTSGNMTVTVKNTGTTSATFTTIGFTGADANDFAIPTTNCPSPFAAGASCTVSVNFKPGAAGGRTAALSFTDSASGSPQSVPLSGTGGSSGTLSVSVTPTSLAFGSVTVGATSAAQTITITNTGSGPLTLNGNTIGGTNASAFIKSATTCSSPLAAGASCTNSIEFEPTAAGAMSATLTVNTNATGTAPTVSLTGTGGSGVSVTVTPTSLAFGSLAVGSTSAPQIITIKNTSAAPITLNGNTIGGTNASSFIKSATTCSSPLAAGASCTNSIEFVPAAAGGLSAVLTVNTSASGTAPTVALSGTGTSGGVTVSVSPTNLSFGSLAVGSTSAAQIITIKNNGTAAITLNGNTIGGTNPSSFVKSATTCSSPLAAGASCTNSIEFVPGAAGALSAVLSVNTSAAGAAPTVSLSGTGTSGAGSTITVTPTSYTFPATAIGATSAAEVITIKNNGSVAVTLNGNTFSGSAAFVKSATSCVSPLAAGASCTNTIQFEPTAAGTFTAVLTVNTSASGTPPTVSFTGSTTAAGLTVSPSALGFATTKVGTTSAAQIITIKNVSSGPITLNGNTFTGSGASSFIKSATTCSSPLPAGASCTNSIEFDPTVTGPISASLSVNSSAPGSPQLIPLNGTGQ